MSDATIERGKVLAYRVFDVANEIALDAAERRLAGQKVKRRMRLGKEGAAEALVFTSLPLEVGLGRRPVRLQGRELEADLFARVFEYGAISIAFEFDVEPGTTFAALTPLCAEIYEAPALEEAGRREAAELLALVGDAAESPRVWGGVETYTVIFVEALEGAPMPARLRSSDALAKLLLGERADKGLSEDRRRDVLGTALSYFDDDLVIIDWNSAFVLEPGGGRQIPEILEFATSQLLEHRYYDSILDRELLRIHDEVARARPRFRLLRSPYAALAREVLRRLVELWEFTERVDNALKVIGDFYLAHVYQAAVRRFRIPAWQASLNEKKELVRQAYELLKGDVDIGRSTALEIVIVLLILFEVVNTLVRH
ncbi:MAG TPA: hypothetical protein VFS43_22980 [Polyangiaceae bacterium]|nr:hypothetical protein [Polyangiaceae bacterium]